MSVTSARIVCLFLCIGLFGCKDQSPDSAHPSTTEERTEATGTTEALGKAAAPASESDSDTEIVPANELSEEQAGTMYDRGAQYYAGDGVPQDFVESAKLFQAAANAGLAEAQYMLAVSQLKGQGVPTDPAQAARWLHRAADQGLPEAQVDLGLLYVNGQGVERDVAKAEQWFRKAALQGHAGAQNNLGSMYQKGWGVPKDLDKAMEWYRKADAQQDPLAPQNIGYLYENGLGVPQDFDKAEEWYRKAVARGNYNANAGLKTIEANRMLNQVMKSGE